MATPQRTRHALPGRLGEIFLDVRAAPGPAARPAVLVLHGFKGFKDWGMFPPFAERLARAGFAAVSLSVSGSGADADGEFAFPDRFGHNTFGAELDDLSAVLDALDAGRLGVTRPASIGIVGHSRGGGTALLFADRTPRVAALATWSAVGSTRRWSAEEARRWREQGVLEVRNSRTGQVMPLYTDLLDEIEGDAAGSLDLEAAAARCTRPWLIAHGTADETVPFAEGKLLAAASSRARFLALDGAGHTFGAVHPFAGMTPPLERLFDETVRFLSAHLA